MTHHQNRRPFHIPTESSAMGFFSSPTTTQTHVPKEKLSYSNLSSSGLLSGSEACTPSRQSLSKNLLFNQGQQSNGSALNSSPGMGVRMKRIDEYFTRKQPSTENGEGKANTVKKAKKSKKTPKPDRKTEQDEVRLFSLVKLSNFEKHIGVCQNNPGPYTKIESE